MEKFNRFEVDGIEVFIHRGLVITGPKIKIDLGGFWKFRHLKASGIQSLEAGCR